MVAVAVGTAPGREVGPDLPTAGGTYRSEAKRKSKKRTEERAWRG